MSELVRATRGASVALKVGHFNFQVTASVEVRCDIMNSSLDLRVGVGVSETSLDVESGILRIYFFHSKVQPQPYRAPSSLRAFVPQYAGDPTANSTITHVP